MLDTEWEARRDFDAGGSLPGLGTPPDLKWNPLSLMGCLVLPELADKDKSLLENLGKMFERVGYTVLALYGRLQIEFIAGEMTDVMERLRFDGLEHRRHAPASTIDEDGVEVADPTTFPRVFDAIQKSNIPDYVGGPLTVMMYAAPLLRADRPSALRFNCLLNEPMFEGNHEHYLAEYMLMHDVGRISDHIGVVRRTIGLWAGEHVMPARLREEPWGSFWAPPFAAGVYMTWDRAPGAGFTIPPHRRLSQPDLERWLHAHLLKLCLPYPRPPWGSAPVYAPLNLTTFLRLVVHRHGLGYPAQWLSGVLEDVCEGAITTTARPFVGWCFGRRTLVEYIPPGVSASRPGRPSSPRFLVSGVESWGSASRCRASHE